MVKYFTDPNAVEPPDMELLYPFVESALPLAYGVLGILLFHVSWICVFLCYELSYIGDIWFSYFGSRYFVCLQELGHFLAAVPKKVKLSIPYFIPNITLGSFGAITQVIILIVSHLEVDIFQISL